MRELGGSYIFLACARHQHVLGRMGFEVMVTMAGPEVSDACSVLEYS